MNNRCIRIFILQGGIFITDEISLEIEDGVINTYVPIKFNYSDNSSYNKFIKKLEESDFVLSEQTTNEKGTDLDLKKILNQVNEAISNTFFKSNEKKSYFKNALNELEEEGYSNLKVTYPNIADDAPIINNEKSILLDFVEIRIDDSAQNVNSTPHSKIESFVSEQLNELVTNTNNSRQYFGPEMTINKKALILWPILLKDKNNEQQIASVSLEFYEYNMAILKISYPIENQTSYPLELNEHDLYHKSCYYNINANSEVAIKEFDYQQVADNSIDSVIDIILKWLEENSNGFIRSESREIIQLNQLTPKNINIKQAKKEEIESVFRIVNAPVADGKKLHPERNKVWKEKYWGSDQFRYVFSNMGKCVAIAGHNVGISLSEDTSKEELKSIIRRDLLMNVEDAYKVMLLNRLNSVNYFLKQNEADYRDLKTFEEDYYFSENYILGLLDFSFGTVRDLYSTIERICSQYLNKESLEKRFNNNRIVLSNRNQERVNKENDGLSILGILITVLVSFPAIYETLVIIQKELITNNIPYVNVFGLSVFFEAVLITFLFYWYRNRNK